MRANTARRLAAVEAKRKPASRVLVCLCATRNGRVNLPASQHLPGCAALDALNGDVIYRVVYRDMKDMRRYDNEPLD